MTDYWKSSSEFPVVSDAKLSLLALCDSIHREPVIGLDVKSGLDLLGCIVDEAAHLLYLFSLCPPGQYMHPRVTDHALMH